MKTFRTTIGLILALAAGTVQAADRLALTGVTPTPWIVKGEGQLLVETRLAVKNSGDPVKLWARIGVPGKSARIEALGEVASGASTVTVRDVERGRS
jgi:hypothetical protein